MSGGLNGTLKNKAEPRRDASVKALFASYPHWIPVVVSRTQATGNRRIKKHMPTPCPHSTSKTTTSV
jgi:hypothetical protein